MGCTRLESGNNVCRSGVLLGESLLASASRAHGRGRRRLRESVGHLPSATRASWSLNSCVLVELVTALRVHADVLTEAGEPNEAERVRRRCRRLARLAVGLSWIMPTERPHALRELSLAWMSRGRLCRAWRLAARSCHHARQYECSL